MAGWPWSWWRFLAAAAAASSGLLKSCGSIHHGPSPDKLRAGEFPEGISHKRPKTGANGVIVTSARAGHCPAKDSNKNGNKADWEDLRPVNVVERAPPRVAESTIEPPQPPVAATAEPAPSRKVKLRPLASLIPYVRRYRGRAGAAFCALLVASLATLAVPLAVRRMIDFGFSREGLNLIDSYFAVMIAVAGVLALASAARYYLVTTLGERIVADLRSEVFAHLTALSIAFFDQAKSGEMLSRLTAYTTQIKAAVGSSVSVALRNVVLFLGAAAMMAVTSPQLSLFVLGAIPVIVLPLYGFGRSVRAR